MWFLLLVVVLVLPICFLQWRIFMPGVKGRPWREQLKFLVIYIVSLVALGGLLSLLQR